MKKSTSIHPGEILLEEFMMPAGIHQTELSSETGIPPSSLNTLIKGGRSVSADHALRLGRYFGTTPEFWLNLQSLFDLAEAERSVGKKIAASVKPREMATA